MSAERRCPDCGARMWWIPDPNGVGDFSHTPARTGGLVGCDPLAEAEEHDRAATVRRFTAADAERAAAAVASRTVELEPAQGALF